MLVITPVGTSLIEHCRRENPEFRTLVQYLRDAPAAQWQNHERRVERAKKLLEHWAHPVRPEMSAEVKSLVKISQEFGATLAARLIATDTVLSRLVAEVLVGVLNDSGIAASFEPALDVIRGLQVTDAKKYQREGLPNLVNRVEELCASAGGWVAINVTGGYKALIPYLTVIAQVHGLQLYYIFEETEELIRIPPAPLDVRWDLFLRYGDALAEVASGVYDWEKFRQNHPLHEDLLSLVWEEGNMAELNPIGRILWERYTRFFLVEVRRGCGYEKEKAGNRGEIEEALRELYERLDRFVRENNLGTTEDLVKQIAALGEQHDLRHGPMPDRDKFVFKSTKGWHVRLVYTPELAPGGLAIRLFDYRRGAFDHKRYLTEFKKQAALWRELEFVTVPLPKP